MRKCRGLSLLAILALVAVLGFAADAAPASAAAPTATPPVITEVTGDSAHVASMLIPEEGQVYWYFEYSTDQVNWTIGPDPLYSHVAEPGTAPVEVSETLTELKGDTKYFVRLSFNPANDPEFKQLHSAPPDSSFTTPHVAPPKALKIGPATGITFFTANFAAEVERPADPQAAADVDCRLEYVSDAEYKPRNEVQKLYVRGRAGTYKLTFGGQTTKSILFNSAPAVVAERLEALSSIGAGNVAVSGGPGDLGGTRPYLIEFTGALSFTDVELMTGDGSGLVAKNGPGEAPVEAFAPGHGEEQFKRASKTSCTPPTVTAPGPAPVEIALTGLTQGTTYHVRLVAESAGGTEYLVGSNFSTVVAPPPTVTMFPIENPGPTSVEAKAIVNPNGTRTIGWFEYSADNGESWRNAPYGDDNIPEPYWCEAFVEPEGRDACAKAMFGSAPLEFNRTINEPNINTYFGLDPIPLEPNTAYIIRIHAENPGGVSISPVVPFKTKNVAPVAQTLNGTGGPETATLSGRVNPKNAPVTFQFEWGLKEGEEDTTYEHVDPVPAEGLPLADNAFHLVSTPISGLQAGTAYHFRITATNVQTEAVTQGVDRTFVTRSAQPEPPACPNETSRVGLSASLPDCRAYEFVSPKMNQGELYLEGGRLPAGAVRADGNRVILNPIDAPEKAIGSHIFEAVLAQRGPDGQWEQIESLSPPNFQPVGEFAGPYRNVASVSPDMTESLVVTDQPVAGPESPEGPGLYLHKADGSFVSISKVNGGYFSYWVAGIDATSDDYKRIFFEPSIAQLKEDPYSEYPFYGNVYEWHAGELKLIGVLPNGELAPRGVKVPQVQNVQGARVWTPDGTSILFTDSETSQLYLRIHAEETVWVSKSHRTAPDPDLMTPPRASTLRADGKQVLFTSRSELTDDAYTGVLSGNRNQAPNLYLFDVESEELTDLTVDHKPEDVRIGAGVRNVLYVTPDFSYIYFVATGNLASGATSGEQNIYVLHNGKITYVAADPGGSSEAGYPIDATPDGTQFVFNSTTNATSYDSNGQSMVYKYTYGAGVECVSCRPSGIRPTSSAAGAFTANLISNDGSRVFFVSQDEVLPQATNGEYNVYEYENGQVHLLSPGDTESQVGLLGASESGDDVFLITTEELAKGEGKAWAAYDAHVDGVVPQEETGAGCQGENCRGPRTEAPTVTSPGTASFEAINRVAAFAPKSVRGGKVQLRVIAPGAGTLQVSGRGVKPVNLQVSRSGSTPVDLTLKKSANGRRKRIGAYRTKGEVLFTATNGDVSRADVSLAFLATTKSRKGGGR